MSEISTFMRSEHERREANIEHNLTTFIEVGNDLLWIRDNRSYQETHKTFEEYCRERWGMSRRNADRLIEASTVVENLRPMGLTPESERQTRPLASLPPEQQREVWDRAVATAPNGKVTAAHVEQVKAEVVGPAPTTIVVEDVEEQPSPEVIDYEKAADAWSKLLDDMILFKVSINRRGGIVTLARKWSQERIDGYIDLLRDTGEFFLDTSNELKGLRK